MVRLGIVFFFLLITLSVAKSQNSATSTGLWSDGSIWSSGTAPTGAQTVNAGYSLIIDQNIVVTTGTFNFGATGGSDEFITDQPGGTAYTLTATTAGGVINIKDGTVTFEGAGLFDDCTLNISAGATLILGATQFENQTTIIVNGTLIINGDLNNNNNGTGTFTIGNGGLVQVNGNYNASTGNVDVSGGGDLFTTGSLNTTGSSDIFGNTNDCASGPCSGRNLCGFSLSISSNQVICLGGSSPADLTSSTNATGPLTYRWQRAGSAGAFTNTTAGSPPVANNSLATTGGGTNTASTYTIDPAYYAATGNDFFRLYMYDSNTACGAFSTSVLLVVVPNSGWKGVTNDWNTNTNWCDNTVPTSGSDATIASFPSGSGKFMPVIADAASGDIRSLTINSGASVTLSGSAVLNVYRNFDNDGTFTASSSSTVNLLGGTARTISGDAFTVFNNLTVNTSATDPAVTLNTNFSVQGTLTLSDGLVDLNSNTLTIGTSTTNPGTVSQSGSWLYNGNAVKYTPATAVAFGSGNDLIPMGDATNYRPFAIAHTALAAGGYFKLTHSSTLGSTAVSFSDTDAVAIGGISNSFWTVAVGGFAGVTGNPFSARASGTGFGLVGNINHLRLVETSSAIAGSTPGTNFGTVTTPFVERTNIALPTSVKTVRFGSTNFVATTLPITLLYFNAKLKNDKVELDWATSEEENFDHFEIERAGSDLRFSTLMEIESTGYNTSSKREYSAFDENPLIGIGYYRLKAVDIDGSHEYFAVKSVDNHSNKKLVVSPNPASGNMLKYSINFEPGAYDRIVLINQVGTELFSTPVTATQNELNLDSRLKPGAYLLRYISPDFQLVFRVFIKE